MEEKIEQIIEAGLLEIEMNFIDFEFKIKSIYSKTLKDE
jgi:hypothetical protein